MDLNPIQAKPVTRPHFVDPLTCVDLENGPLEHVLTVALELLHGANYNDPAPFGWPGPEQVMTSAFPGSY